MLNFNNIWITFFHPLDIRQACQLPIFEYVSERMCSCCYERAWYAKLGGCCAIKIMMEKMDLCWVLSHLYQFLKALLFVMLDLTGEVSIFTRAGEKTTSDADDNSL